MNALYGIGVDIVEVGRVSQAVTRWGHRFLSRVYTPGELDYCRTKSFPSQHLAARFAAKEAVMKAIGTGMNARIGFRGIEIVKDSSGPPVVRLDDSLLPILPRHLVVRVSLSHTRAYATAFAIAAIEDPVPTTFSHEERHHDQVH